MPIEVIEVFRPFSHLIRGVHLRPIFSKTRTGRHSRRIYSSPLPTPLGIFAKEVRDDDLPEYEHRVSPTPLVIAPVRRGLWWLSARARLVRTISECPAEGRRTRWRCHRVASIEGAIKMLEKHVSDHRLCIHGAQPPCHHTAVCAMVDLGKQPARWPCLLRLASPYDVELPRSTLVARPAVHRNHLAPPARHRGPNSAQTPPVSHPGSARPRSCCRYVGNHSRRAALRSPEHEYHLLVPPHRPAVDGRR